jgi:myo-inositol-1(or 4)-monophosphatase
MVIGAEILRIRMNGWLAIVTKRDASDLQTAADRYSEKEVAGLLRRIFPGIGIWGEEGISEQVLAPLQAIVDPVDGTTPFAMGQDNFSISVGIEFLKNLLEAGFLYFPAQQKFVHAIYGEGAFIDGKRVDLPKGDLELKDILVGFDFAAGSNRRAELDDISGVAAAALGLRIEGSFTGGVLKMLEGTWGAYVHLGATPFDLAAAVVIAREAGFAISDTWNLGKEFSPVIFARTPALLDAIRPLTKI